MEIKRGIAVSPGVAIGPALVLDSEWFRIPQRVRVEDGRGCIVQQAETLTQPASDMAVSLLDKKDNDCADGLAGS